MAALLSGQAGITSSAKLTTNPTGSISAKAAVSGIEPVNTVKPASTLTANGQVTVAALKITLPTANTVGKATLTSGVIITKFNQDSMHVTATATPQATPVRLGGFHLAANGAVVAVGLKIDPGVGNLSAQASLNLSGRSVALITASLSAMGYATPSARTIQNQGGSLQGTASLSGAFTQTVGTGHLGISPSATLIAGVIKTDVITGTHLTPSATLLLRTPQNVVAILRAVAAVYALGQIPPGPYTTIDLGPWGITGDMSFTVFSSPTPGFVYNTPTLSRSIPVQFESAS